MVRMLVYIYCIASILSCSIAPDSSNPQADQKKTTHSKNLIRGAVTQARSGNISSIAGSSDSGAVCPACPAINGRLTEILANYSSLSLTSHSFEDDLNKCYEIGKIAWEDETLSGPNGGDLAFNCRDFSRWFVECMRRLQHEDTHGIAVLCKNCESKSAHGHAIVIYKKPDGKWCPGEPQSEPRNGRNGEITQCCSYDKEEAKNCALQDHCGRTSGGAGALDPCCEGSKVFDFDQCMNEKCRFMTVDPKTGRPMLTCTDIPGIGTNPGPITPAPRNPFWTGCEKAKYECLKDSTRSCTECFSEHIAACGAPNKCVLDEGTGSSCVDCCNKKYNKFPSGGWINTCCALCSTGSNGRPPFLTETFPVPGQGYENCRQKP
ncbi:MAG: hypothetical protein RIQ81_1147 [Pseudomonadota bacterium]